MERRSHAQEGLGGWIVEKDRIGGGAGIEALRHEVDLLLLEGAGDVHFAPNAQEQWPGIVREAPAQMLAKLGEIKAAIDHQSRHAGAAVAPRDAHPADLGFPHATKLSDPPLDLLSA